MTTSLTRILLYSFWAGISSHALAQGKPLVGHGEAGFETLQAVDNEVLDEMRGGFVVDGVKFDIGLQKMVYTDGILQAQNTFDNIGNINLNGNTLTARDVQNLTSSINTLVQNHLDNKTIQALTVVDVNVKNIASLQGGFVEAMRSLQNIQLER